TWSVGAWFHRLRMRGLGWYVPNWRIVRWWDQLCWLIGAWLFRTRQEIGSQGLFQSPFSDWWADRALARTTRRAEAAARADEQEESRAGLWFFTLRWAVNDWFWRVHERGRVWGRARSWSRLAGAAPLLLVAAAAAPGAVALRLEKPAALVESYRQRAARAFEAQDYPIARMCCERLAAFGDDQPDLRFRLALTLESLGQGDRAARLLADLASPEGAD